MYIVRYWRNSKNCDILRISGEIQLVPFIAGTESKHVVQMRDVERVGTRLELGYNVLSTRITTCRRIRGQLKVGVFRARVRGAEERRERMAREGERKRVNLYVTERILRKTVISSSCHILWFCKEQKIYCQSEWVLPVTVEQLSLRKALCPNVLH